MLSGAYWGNYHRIAASVCAEQDISDIFVYFGKNIQKSQKRFPFVKKMLRGILVVVTIVWFMTRVVLLGIIVIGGWLYIPKESLYKTLTLGLLCQLTVLLIMQTIWWLGLLKMCYEQFTTGTFHDMWHDGAKRKMEIIANGNGEEKKDQYLVANGNGEEKKDQ